MGHRQRRRTRVKGEKGYVLIMAALLLLPLLAFTGFAVDIGSWYTHANRMQRAVDAAALAGVVWMPNDEKAEQVALETAKANGFDDAAANIQVTITPVGNRRLRVYVHDTNVNRYFSSLFVNAVDIERQALAEYVQSVPMGSPDNSLGNDPERWGATGYNRPYYWLNVASPDSTKVNGDQYTAGDCNGTFTGCTNSSASGVNLNYSQDGYFYRLTVDTKPASGDLRIQAFDPAFLDVGNTCLPVGTNPPPHNLPAAGSTWNAQAATLVSQGAPADAATRYAQGNNQWCVADSDQNGNDIQTTYIVRGPDSTPFDNNDNPVLCTKTFGAYDESVYPLLNQADGYKDGNRGPENMPFVAHFRRWVDLCTVNWNQVEVGDYLLQVTSTADLSNVPTSATSFDPLVSTGGYNKFALRAGFGAPAAATFPTGINFFADGRLPIYVNQAGFGTVTNFYLARIVPEYAGQILELELFDVADGSSATLTIVPPADATGTAISGCTFIRDATTPVVTTSSTCSQSGLTTANYNGRSLTAQIPLPENYGCNAGSDQGCWFKINLDFGSSGTPTDQTTWSARVRGDPVRLVE